MELAKGIMVFLVGLVVGLLVVGAADLRIQTDQAVQDEALAELILFGEDLPTARRAGFEVKVSMMVGVGEPNEADADYDFLLKAAETGEVFPASRFEALRAAFSHAHRVSRGAGEDAEIAQSSIPPRWSSSSVVVSSADSPGYTSRAGIPSFNPPANTQASASVDTRVISSEDLLAGVRVYGAEMAADEYEEATLDPWNSDPAIPPIGTPAAYLRDGEAFAGVGRYHHRSLGMPVTVVAVVECRRVDVEDIFFALIECDADSELARELSSIAPHATMTQYSRHRRGVSEKVVRAHAEGGLKILSRSRIRGVGSIRGSMHTMPFHGFRGRPVMPDFERGIDDPALQLDIGFGEGPTRIAAPRPSFPNHDVSGRVPRRLPSDNGDLRVLLTGEKDGRFRAILCLQVASYTND
ncbi:MAG: hypothetical protein JJU33_00650 [Phycisphaerales bacterium]|nr:hypothetical protein [Phycisphaerales bacterium]